LNNEEWDEYFGWLLLKNISLVLYSDYVKLSALYCAGTVRVKVYIFMLFLV
jgi:hypothetical protein